MKPNQTNRFALDTLIVFFHNVFQAIIFPISLIPLIRYVSATLFALALSTVTQQIFLILHYFKHGSKFLPIVSLCDSKSDLNSIFFYSTPTLH
jgi:hypothetical protein